MTASPALDLTTVVRVGRLWRLRFTELCPDLLPAGSPERSLARAVAATEDGRRYVVERLAPEMALRKMRIAALLEAFAQEGLEAVNPYLAAGNGHHVLPLGSDYWQISPYLEGVPLPRPGWVWEAWRGAALARFLLQLRQVAARLRLPGDSGFSLHGFCRTLQARLRGQRPTLASALDPIEERLLGEWLPPEGMLATGFGHGDPHPLNVIWGESDTIRAVIDWEFAGIKPAAYDAALIIGCVGIEEPRALAGPLVRTLLGDLRAGGHPAGTEPALWALVLAIRFAWLADWLRRSDEQMVALETDYIRLLVEKRTELSMAWSGSS